MKAIEGQNGPGRQRRKTKEELAKGCEALKLITPDFTRVTVEVPYEGITFTVAKATLVLPKSENIVISEGVSRRSCIDRANNYTGFNLAVKRALESLDKKLRRDTGFVGHRFEG